MPANQASDGGNGANNIRHVHGAWLRDALDVGEQLVAKRLVQINDDDEALLLAFLQ